MAETWLWLVKTPKGDFFLTVTGDWTQEQAAIRVRAVFDVYLKLNIIEMVARKRAIGPDDMQATIYEVPEEPGFHLMGGKKIWEACGRGAEYEAAMASKEKD